MLRSKTFMHPPTTITITSWRYVVHLNLPITGHSQSVRLSTSPPILLNILRPYECAVSKLYATIKWYHSMLPIKWHQLQLTILSNAFSRTKKETPASGSDAACLAEALSKRGVPWRCLRPHQVKGEFSPKGKILTFQLSTKDYFFQNGRFWMA